MATPKVIFTAGIYNVDGNIGQLEIYEYKLKDGFYYYFPLEGATFKGLNAIDLSNVVNGVGGIRFAIYNQGFQRIEFHLRSNITFDLPLLNRLKQEIQEFINKSKNNTLPLIPPTSNVSVPSPFTSDYTSDDLFLMGMIKTSYIIEYSTDFGQSLKETIIRLFENDGFPFFYELPTMQDMESELTNRILGLSLEQAIHIRVTLEKYYDEKVKNNIQLKANIAVTFDNNYKSINPPIIGINKKFINSKSPIKSNALKINGIKEKYVDEYDNVYEAEFEGKEIYIPRTDFFIKGDKFTLQNEKNKYVLITILGSRVCRFMTYLNGKHKFELLDIDALSNFNPYNFETFEYNKLGNYFFTKYPIIAKNIDAPINTLTPKIESPLISGYESEVQRLNKEISELIVLKNLTPKFKIENIINIEGKVAKKQKEVNELAVVIADNKMADNAIFDELFEQSFLPLKNRYDDVIKLDTPNVSGNFFTPNGQESKLSDELNLFIRTPLFTDWFGNWQLAYQYKDIPNSGMYCSKVLTSDYEPKLVWHGTSAEFSYFKFDNFPASYYAVNRSYCDFFATIRTNDADGGYILPFFLNLRNPLNLTRFGTRDVSSKDFFDYLFLVTGISMEYLEVNPMFFDQRVKPLQTWMYLRNNPKMLKKLSESNVFDGIHFYETNPNVPTNELGHMTEAYITFKPESSKIADPDRGNLLFASMKSFLLKKGGKI
jgi:hypothetical protein